jgi:alginate O-acetyltransferase complex protein AlgI
MIFTSYSYVAFVLAVFLLYWLLPGQWRKPLLIIVSYLFYCSWKWQYGFLLLGVTFFNWSYARWILSRANSTGLLFLGIAINLAPLVYFKYTGFLLTNLAAALGAAGVSWHLSIPEILLPLGISFFSFQGMAYLIDVAAGEPPINGVQDFVLFKAFWPQLIAGPIIRPGELREQLETPRVLDYGDLAYGTQRVLNGFFKKVVVADTLAPFADMVFLPGAVVNGVDVIAGAMVFGLQIYFDFSGYSDIAIGTARLFGFVFPENFNWPYLASSPQEFWTRWHMTLSRWIRDYVFTPLAFAGRRYSWAKHWWLLGAMAACGLWHGAQWTFVCWGVWHGVLLLANQTILKPLFPYDTALQGGSVIRKAFACALTFGLVTYGWVFFRAASLTQVWSMTTAAITLRGGFRPAVLRENAILIAFTVLVAMLLLGAWDRRSRQTQDVAERSLWRRALGVGTAVIMIISVIVFDSEAKTFVYFQF